MRGAPARSMMKIISKTAAFATRLPFSSLASPVFEVICASRSERLLRSRRRRELP
jgi:hypothetical protein